MKFIVGDRVCHPISVKNFKNLYPGSGTVMKIDEDKREGLIRVWVLFDIHPDITDMCWNTEDTFILIESIFDE